MALSWFRAADLQKLVVFYVFQIARATLCGLWAGRPSKTRRFLRFSNRPRDPLRTLGWSTFENSWFFAIFKLPARPSADFGLVDLRKLVVFSDFQIARATLCGLWAGRPSKTRGFLRFSNRLRDLGWSTFENSWFFAIFNSPARPSAEFRVAKSLSSRCGAHFLKAVNPKPLPSQGDLLQSALDVSSKRCRAIGIASDTLLKNFSLSAHARAQFFSSIKLSFQKLCFRSFSHANPRSRSRWFAIEKRASFSATTLNLLRKIWLPNEMGAWVGGVFNQQLWMKRSL